jgi:hypothetical protein
MAEGNGVVVDHGRWKWSEMWKKEDWWAIWIGFFILVVGMFVYFPHSGEMKEIINKADVKYGQAAQRTSAMKTIAWYKWYDAKKKAEARKIPAGKWLASFTHKTHSWSDNPLDAFFMSKAKAAAKADKAKAKYAKKKAEEETMFAAAPCI